jgi:predicted amidohydrolase
MNIFYSVLVFALVTFNSFASAPLRIAAINYKITGGKTITDQIKRIELLANEAHAKGADYLLLPELISFDLFPIKPNDKKIKEELELLAGIFPDYEKRLKTIALKNHLNLIGASSIIKYKKSYINRAFYINDQGIVKYQDKVFPTPWEKKNGFVGGKRIVLFKDKNLSFVILICHDAEFPKISNSLAHLRPEVIFVPSQTDDESGLERVRATSAARSIEHFSYVVMTGASSEEKAPWHSYLGKNFLFTPQNKYFLNQNKGGGKVHQEELSLFEIDLKTLQKGRNDESQVNPARDQN